MKYNFFSKKATIFEYDPIVHFDYTFSYIATYLYHLMKGLLITTVFAIIVNFLSENNHSTSLPQLTKIF